MLWLSIALGVGSVLLLLLAGLLKAVVMLAIMESDLTRSIQAARDEYGRS